MSKHTSGPWEIDPEGNVIVKGDANATIAWVSSPDSYENGDEPMMANARLIAAAPDLLDVCKRMVAEAGDRDMKMTPTKVMQFVTIYADMRTAIAKAEGA